VSTATEENKPKKPGTNKLAIEKCRNCGGGCKLCSSYPLLVIFEQIKSRNTELERLLQAKNAEVDKLKELLIYLSGEIIFGYFI